MRYIGIDNGVTGSVGIIFSDRSTVFEKVPVKVEQDYTKKKQNITRIDFEGLNKLIYSPNTNVKVIIERPMVNPMRFKASTSALRAFEIYISMYRVTKVPIFVYRL